RYYDADLFEIDQKRLLRWYQMKGFFEAKIVEIKDTADDKGRVTLHIKIEEGKRTKVSKQDFEGMDKLTQKEQHRIDAELPIHPGDWFDEDTYEKAKDVMQLQLKERGFAQADVDGKVEVNIQDATAHIIFTADPGERFKFGKVTVSGNRRISSKEITFATGITPGMRYSPETVALAQQRVYNLGTFSGVRVGLEPLGDDPIAGLRVNVREAPFQTFRFGIGGSAEDERWVLPRLHGEYTNRSLLGGLRRLELSSTVGYAFVNSPFDYKPDQSGITSENSAVVTIPNIFTPGLDSVNRAEFDREVQGGYSYDQFALRAGLLYRYGRHSIAPSMNLVRYFLVNLEGTDLSSVITTAGTNAAIFNDCPAACTVTYPELRYTYDGRNNAIETTKGFYGTISIQQTIKGLSKTATTAFNYFRINPEVRYFLPLGRFVVLAGRAEYGALITEGDNGASPFTQRFAFGGQNDQRGYSPLQQSPKLGATPTCTAGPFPCEQPFATQTVSVGGKTALLFSFEVRLKADYILNHLGIVPFVDASRVSNDVWSKPLQHGPLEVSPGLGLRYITAFGAIRLDVAYIANPQTTITQEVDGVNKVTGQTVPIILPTRVSANCPDGDRGCISMSRYAFHVTLGEAF
ncbi:MAG TPA: POTRA domain-containing protein, partial [Myxococcales bacterium]|nr:POTRA domain-containing protein [Myxococcales bacterium]